MFTENWPSASPKQVSSVTVVVYSTEGATTMVAIFEKAGQLLPSITTNS